MLPLTPGAPRVQRVILIDDVLGLFTAAREAIILAEAVAGIVESVVQIGWGLFRDWLGGITYDPTLRPASRRPPSARSKRRSMPASKPVRVCRRSKSASGHRRRSVPRAP